MKSLKTLGLFILQCAVIGLAVAFLVVFLKPELLLPETTAPQSAPASYADAVDASAAAVVNVHTRKRVASRVPAFMNDPILRQLFGDQFVPRERIETSLGSGVIVKKEGYILTNYHVIQGADAIQVALADGRFAPATVVGTDPETDLALLKIDLENLPVITMGNSDTLRTGDVVLAIGSPFGLGQTVTQGIVSATGRSAIGLTLFENFIQTDAAINMGNSGGALINTQGELVGINTALLSRTGGSNGIGFAIPVNLARGVMQQLIEHGRVMRGWLGLSGQPLTPALAKALNVPTGVHGIVINRVFPDSPAKEAGIQVRDVITAINNKPVASERAALNRIASLRPGTVVGLQLIRDGKPFELDIAIAERK
ncbi:MAG TPA: trypsin-like peptidase domain-containing protein [Gammaproteobacteria bacterium]|nr:trypsin-like peptidase domain-containing protein [Gammaproteobacteria bacterium]